MKKRISLLTFITLLASVFTFVPASAAASVAQSDVLQAYDFETTEELLFTFTDTVSGIFQATIAEDSGNKVQRLYKNYGSAAGSSAKNDRMFSLPYIPEAVEISYDLQVKALSTLKLDNETDWLSANIKVEAGNGDNGGDSYAYDRFPKLCANNGSLYLKVAGTDTATSTGSTVALNTSGQHDYAGKWITVIIRINNKTKTSEVFAKAQGSTEETKLGESGNIEIKTNTFGMEMCMTNLTEKKLDIYLDNFRVRDISTAQENTFGISTLSEDGGMTATAKVTDAVKRAELLCEGEKIADIDTSSAKIFSITAPASEAVKKLGTEEKFELICYNSANEVIDTVIIYKAASFSGYYITNDETVPKYMKDAAALYAGSARLYKDGAVSEESAALYFDGDTAYIPLDTAKKIYSDADSLPIYNGSYVSAAELCTMSGKKLTNINTEVSNGLIVIADRENFFNFKDDIGIYRTLCGQLVLRKADGEAMKNHIINNTSHPRLFMDSNDFESLKQKIETDDFLKARHEQMLSLGNAYTEKDSDGNYAHKLFVDKLASDEEEWSRTESVFNKITQVGYCYRMTGDEKYAKRCIDEVLGICNMNSWIPPNNSFLATAGLMISAALGYDWMYDSTYMTAENKTIIENAMKDKGMAEIIKDYEGTSTGRSYFWAQSPKPDNWNFVCNNAGLISAMAFADAPLMSAQSKKIFDSGMKLLRKAAVLYAPDGAWCEGPDYWEYGTRHFIMTMQNLQKVFGDTYGFMDLPGIHESGYYAIAQEGPMGSFNVGDSAEGDATKGNANTSPSLLFIASYYKDENLWSLVMNTMRNMSDMSGIRVNLAHMYNIAYYDSELSEKVLKTKNDWYFRDSEIAVMHKSIEDIQNDVFAALHAGKNDTPHGHLDAGQFVIDAYGTRFACDTGYESDSPNVKQNYYRYRTEGHNTLVINPNLSPGQRVEGFARIDSFDTDGSSAIAVTDLTDMYENAENIKRELKFTDTRSVITVQDEISLNEPSDIWWFMHSRQNIAVADDGQSAVISGNKNMDMLVRLSSSVPGAFTVMDAMPMEDSLKTISNNLKNAEFKKLALHFENTQDLTISVTMSFIPKGSSSLFINSLSTDSGFAAIAKVADGTVKAKLFCEGEEIAVIENASSSKTFNITASASDSVKKLGTEKFDFVCYDAEDKEIDRVTEYKDVSFNGYNVKIRNDSYIRPISTSDTASGAKYYNYSILENGTDKDVITKLSFDAEMTAAIDKAGLRWRAIGINENVSYDGWLPDQFLIADKTVTSDNYQSAYLNSKNLELNTKYHFDIVFNPIDSTVIIDVTNGGENIFHKEELFRRFFSASDVQLYGIKNLGIGPAAEKGGSGTFVLTDITYSYLEEMTLSPVNAYVTMTGERGTTADRKIPASAKSVSVNVSVFSEIEPTTVKLYKDGAEVSGAFAVLTDGTLTVTDEALSAGTYTIEIPAGASIGGEALAYPVAIAFEVYNTDGYYIGDIDMQNDGEKVTSKVFCKNFASGELHAVLITAVYNGDKMAAVDVSKANSVSGTGYLESNVLYTDMSTSVKSFVWKSLDSEEPYGIENSILLSQ